MKIKTFPCPLKAVFASYTIAKSDSGNTKKRSEEAG